MLLPPCVCHTSYWLWGCVGTDRLNIPHSFYTVPIRYRTRDALVGVVQGKHSVTGRLGIATNREGNLDRSLTASITNITNSNQRYQKITEKALTIQEAGGGTRVTIEAATLGVTVGMS